MRIGLPGGGATVDKIVRQAERAEADGFASLWYASAVAGDPLVAMALAGRATSRSSSAPRCCRPTPAIRVLQATRAAAVVAAIGAPGRFTLGVGPSHQPVVEGDARRAVRQAGAAHRRVRRDPGAAAARRAGERRRRGLPGARRPARPRRRRRGPGPGGRTGAPAAAGRRPADRRHHPVDGQRPGDRTARRAPHPQGRGRRRPARAPHRGRASRSRCTTTSPRPVRWPPGSSRSTAPCPTTSASSPTAGWPGRPSRDRGGRVRVAAQLEALFDAGATDVWAAPFPVGDDRSASRARTRALLKELATG